MDVYEIFSFNVMKLKDSLPIFNLTVHQGDVTREMVRGTMPFELNTCLSTLNISYVEYEEIIVH